MSADRLTKPYDPLSTETRLYRQWEEGGYFAPGSNQKISRAGKIFSLVLPPPNVTGTLHLGHAAMVTIEDIMTRFHRMRGYDTLWIPGTDHAAIATQQKVENIIFKEEGKTRADFSREEFLERINTFAHESHDTIVGQVRALGASVDWTREAYTLDDDRSRAVRVAFKQMYDDGLIYRGARLVNWDPKLQTTVSDDEIDWQDETTPFYYLKYGPFTIGTARPETKFGDKYVVMHPTDPRYESYTHGQKLTVEWINGPISATIIKDTAIDMSFGTGVMTITPAHDSVDFAIAERHNLEHEQIIDLKGKLLPIAGDLAGIHIKKARPLIVEKLTAKGLVEKVEEHYQHRLATNSRGGGIIEPQILKQWFVAVEKEFTLRHSRITGIASGEKTTLKTIMRRAVESGQISIIPDYFQKTYFHWIDNLHDWCISRQILFGHQIPVWYHKTSTPLPDGQPEEMYVGLEAPAGQGWEQDPDTLDTWFSSGLWTFSTLGWPEKNEEIARYHPLSVLETGHDILFFWVARMILMTGYLLGDVPFRQIYLHGLVRDGQGRKMSKSLGNIVDPLEMISKYGTDALRLSLVMGTAAGTDSRISEDKIRGYKHFANKLWNIGRFVLTNTAELATDETPPLTASDQKHLAELTVLVAEITPQMADYRFYLAGERLYHYLWHTFADIIIEEAKEHLRSVDDQERRSSQSLLRQIFYTSLKLLHPFMPFITEELWSLSPHAPGDNALLIVSTWPTT